MKKIAAIILNYNSSADCFKCVSHLKHQQGVKLKMVIVDNCSRPEETEAAERLAQEQGCTFIASRENRGYNAGNNIGLRYAAGLGFEYALIANPDMEFPQTDYVSRLAAEMQQRPDVVVVGSDIVTPEGIHQNPRKYDKCVWTDSFNWLTAIMKRSRITRDLPDWIENPGESHDCRGLNGCCFLIRMDFVKQIGFFDEGVFLFGEESILSYQVAVNGLKMHYLASVQALHNHRKSKEPVSAFCLKHWKHSRIYYVKKYTNYPWYGKLVAIFSIHLYFLSLSLSNTIKSKLNG